MNTATPACAAGHSMQKTLSEYVRMKMPDDDVNDSWARVIVVGLHKRSPPAVISKKEKHDKPFNWQRPTITVMDPGRLQINCFPGRDYVFHYATIAATYLSLSQKSDIPVLFEYPTPSQCRSILRRSNLREMGNVDIVVIGYVQHLKRFLKGAWHRGSTEDGLFAWQKSLTPQGQVIAFLGCMTSFWREISGHLVRELQETNHVKCVVYVGKAGALQAKHAPNQWIATGGQSLIDDRTVIWENVLGPDIKTSLMIAEGAHITISTPLLESREWFNKWAESSSWVDCEVGHMAEASIEGHTLFGFLHIISDNLARSFPHDLANERLADVIKSRNKLFHEVEDVLERFFARSPLETSPTTRDAASLGGDMVLIHD